MGVKGRESRVSSPYRGSQKYHDQGHDQDDGAGQVGMKVAFQLILWRVDELKGYLLLGRSPDTSQTQGFRYGPHGILKQANLVLLPLPYLFLIPFVQVPALDLPRTLSLPDLQEDGSCSEHRERSQDTWGEPGRLKSSGWLES